MRVFLRWLAMIVALLLVICPAVWAQSEDTKTDTTVPADRASFGWRIQAVDLESGNSGMQLSEVSPGGPADQAGLMAGDVVTHINGESFQLENDLDMILRLNRVRVGNPLELDYLRGEATHHVRLHPTEMSTSRRAALVRWIEIAQERLSNSKPLYCNRNGCQEELPAGAFKPPARISQILRSLEDRGEILVTRNVTSAEWQFQAQGVSLPGGFELDDFPAHLRQSLEELAPGEMNTVTLTRDADGGYSIQLLPQAKRSE